MLIRDVAYGMLPKAVRARKHFEVGSFVEQRAGDRTDEVVQLLAEHYGRAAALGIDAGIPQPELDRMQRLAMFFLEQAGDAAGLLYANREAASPRSRGDATHDLCAVLAKKGVRTCSTFLLLQRGHAGWV